MANRRLRFETHSPVNLTMPYVLPNDGEVVGVGQPIAVRFDENITDREAAQGAITVKTDPPVEGRLLLAEQPRSAVAPSQILEARHLGGRDRQHLRCRIG